MIIDRKEAEDILGSFPTLPMPGSAVCRTYNAGDLEIRYHRNPESAGSDVVIAISYAVTVHYKGKYIFASSIERDDLRAISPMIGVPLRELQEEYGVKGFYGEPKVLSVTQKREIIEKSKLIEENITFKFMDGYSYIDITLYSNDIYLIKFKKKVRC